MSRIRWSREGLASISQQLHWIHLKHLLPKTMYNLLLPNVMCYNYCRLPTVCNSGLLTSWCSLIGVSWVNALWYCTVPSFCVFVTRVHILYAYSRLNSLLEITRGSDNKDTADLTIDYVQNSNSSKNLILWATTGRYEYFIDNKIKPIFQSWLFNNQQVQRDNWRLKWIPLPLIWKSMELIKHDNNGLIKYSGKYFSKYIFLQNIRYFHRCKIVGFESPCHLWLSTLLRLHSHKSKSIIHRSPPPPKKAKSKHLCDSYEPTITVSFKIRSRNLSSQEADISHI